MHGGLDLLHRQVRALDQAHLDARAAACTPGCGPLLQADHRREGVREVGLQHDPRLEVLELRLIQQSGEDRDGEIEVLELLHVEVDELPRAGGGGSSEERSELLHDIRDRFIERPRRMRRDGGRDLDRDVVHVAPPEQAQRAVEASARLALAEDRFAEQVHVEPDSLGPDLRDRRTETRVGGVDDEVPDHPAEHAAGDRHDDSRQKGRRPPADPHRGAKGQGQEAGNDGRDPREVASGHPQVLGPDHSVDEADREVEPLRVFEHSGETGAGRIDPRGRRLEEPPFDQRYGLVDQVEIFCTRMGGSDGRLGDLGHGHSLRSTH